MLRAEDVEGVVVPQITEQGMVRQHQFTQTDWVHCRVQDGTYIVWGQRPFRTLSSSLLGGGLQKKRYLLNVQVPHGYASEEPWRDLERKVIALHLPLEDTVAMMTAAEVEQPALRNASGEQFRLQVIVTAGVGNAARSGTARKTYPGYTAGTINTIAVIDGRMTDAALVNAVLTITEAKAAALQELGVCNANGQIATGTTTDTVIVAATQNPEYTGIHQYVGVATELGNKLGQAVYACLLDLLQKPQKRWDRNET